MTEAYCVKCKKKVEVNDGKEKLSKNGVKMLKGICPECGTKVCRFLGK